MRKSIPNYDAPSAKVRFISPRAVYLLNTSQDLNGIQANSGTDNNLDYYYNGRDITED